MARKRSKPKNNSMAGKADKYKLYGLAVQEADHEAEFFDKTFKTLFKRKASVLREDFCGTFAICCEWVKRRGDKRAIGVDLDPEPLDWGRANNLPGVPEKKRERVQLFEADVRDTDLADEQGEPLPGADILAAQNFSFWVFKTRDEVRDYFEAAHANLADEGMMVIDLMGGGGVMEEDHEDQRKIAKGVKYIWEQERFDPITHHCRYHIHFRFKDGSALERAFTYDWRLWSIPEVTELLYEAGFDDVVVYWEDEDEDTGEGNGTWRQRKHAPSDPTWIAYVIGVKRG